jgi:hypothetical protein
MSKSKFIPASVPAAHYTLLAKRFRLLGFEISDADYELLDEILDLVRDRKAVRQ